MIDKFNNYNIGILAIRLALALVFIAHGWQKFVNLEQTGNFFDSLGLPMLMVYVVALVELLGGLAMLLGIWTKIAGWLLAINMLFAIILVKLSKGFLGGYEFELTLLLSALGVSFMNPGKFSMGKKEPMA